MTTIPSKPEKGIDLMAMTAGIVSAYLGNHAVQVSQIPDLIKDVHGALTRAATGVAVEAAVPEPETPKPTAAEIRKSVQPDSILCFEDGKRFKSLKRHLQTHFGLTPDEYRTKWGLARDYPMVAPAYAQRRSELARQIGLGRKPSAPAKAA